MFLMLSLLNFVIKQSLCDHYTICWTFYSKEYFRGFITFQKRQIRRLSEYLKTSAIFCEYYQEIIKSALLSVTKILICVGPKIKLWQEQNLLDLKLILLFWINKKYHFSNKSHFNMFNCKILALKKLFAQFIWNKPLISITLNG